MSAETPEDNLYTREHEWLRIDGDTVTVGITGFAQEALGDIVFVQLPVVGAPVTAGVACGEVESTKSVSDVYAPVTGEVAARNDALDQTPELINSDPYGDGWLLRVTMPEGSTLEPATFLSASEYAAHIAD